jgi:hypothetical protein
MAFDFNKVKAKHAEDEFDILTALKSQIDNIFDYNDYKDNVLEQSDLYEIISEIKNRISFSKTPELQHLGNVIAINIKNFDLTRGSTKVEYAIKPFIKKILIAIYKVFLNNNKWMPTKNFIEFIINKKDYYNIKDSDLLDYLRYINKELHVINLTKPYDLNNTPFITHHVNVNPNDTSYNTVYTSFEFNIKNFVEYMIFVNNTIYTKINEDEYNSQIFGKSPFLIYVPDEFFNRDIIFTNNGAQNFVDFLKWCSIQGAFNISIHSKLLLPLINALPKTTELGPTKTLKEMILINAHDKLCKSYDELISESFQFPVNDVIKPAIEFMENLKIK